MGWMVNATLRLLYPRERPGTHYIGGWVGPRAGLDRCGKYRPNGIRSPDRPARGKSLCCAAVKSNCPTSCTFTLEHYTTLRVAAC